MDANLRLNLRGTIFQIPRNLSQNYPECRLAKLDEADDNFEPISGEFFFNRNPTGFHSILDLFEVGSLHIPGGWCLKSFENEMRFWDISLQYLDDCCWDKYQRQKIHVASFLKLQNDWDKSYEKFLSKEDNDVKEMSMLSNFYRKLYEFLEVPTSSFLAKIYSVFLIAVILLCNLTMCLDTLLIARELEPGMEEEFMNVTEQRNIYIITRTRPKAIFLAIEICATTILTLDIILRLICHPKKRYLVTSFLFIADVLSILSVWTFFFMEIAIGRDAIFSDPHLANFAYVLLCTRILRSFRFIQIASLLECTSFRVIMVTLKSSLNEFTLLFTLLFVSVFIYANLIFYVELKTDNITSVPLAFWWAIITMTTVGYGDYSPVTTAGYVVGACCAVTGILIVALPIPIIGKKFDYFYAYIDKINRLGMKTSTKRKSDRKGKGKKLSLKLKQKRSQSVTSIVSRL